MPGSRMLFSNSEFRREKFLPANATHQCDGSSPPLMPRRHQPEGMTYASPPRIIFRFTSGGKDLSPAASWMVGFRQRKSHWATSTSIALAVAFSIMVVVALVHWSSTQKSFLKTMRHSRSISMWKGLAGSIASRMRASVFRHVRSAAERWYGAGSLKAGNRGSSDSSPRDPPESWLPIWNSLSDKVTPPLSDAACPDTRGGKPPLPRSGTIGLPPSVRRSSGPPGGLEKPRGVMTIDGLRMAGALPAWEIHVESDWPSPPSHDAVA
mmetsp:Transcript_8488/g.20896  ORF Transcript_8488/g.20896 Transcript_8488/m.20896 type:complete len:266 (+) Transcript_8488:1784-2581(+)